MKNLIASDYEEANIMTARTCGSECKNAKVVYSFADDGQMLFLDKKDVTKNQLEAC
jgi:hypothetical protein